MKVIAFEGLDKSGKKTQSDLLVAFLRSLGYKVHKTEFHRYDTPTGKLVRQYLYGEYKVDDLTIELIMSADKHAQQTHFKELKQNGVDFLVIDRYIGSQLCYARAKGVDSQFSYQLQKFLIKPDLEIMYDILPETSISRRGEHGENDRYERSIELLTSVRKEYLNYFNESDTRHVIHSCDELTVDEIAGKTTKLVKSKLII